jgi:NAD(P)H-dependent FMN reductase
MLEIAVILGSTRPGRRGEAVARWVHEVASRRDDATYTLLDLLDYDLAHLDEAVPPAAGRYRQPHTIRWAETVARFDGFVVVTPEYNHSVPGALKNALDFVYAEWNNKAAGFVSYGVQGGLRAVEHLRLVMAELQVASVRSQVALSLRTDFRDRTVFEPPPYQERALGAVLDQVVAWSGALRPLRYDTGHTPE